MALLDVAGIRKALVLSLAYQHGNPNRLRWKTRRKGQGRERLTSAQVSPAPGSSPRVLQHQPAEGLRFDEIARCGKDAQLRRGLKLHFGNSDVISQTALYLARLKQVFALANRQGMAIVVHMRASVTMKRDYGASRGRSKPRMSCRRPRTCRCRSRTCGAGGYNDPGADEVMGVFVEAIASDPRVRRLYFDVSGVAGSATGGRVRPRSPRDWGGIERAAYGPTAPAARTRHPSRVGSIAVSCR